VHQQADEQGIKLLVLGGGGYTIRNVARAWTYETALCLRQEVPEDLPPNDYWEYYTPDHKISVPSNTMENLNTKEFLDKLKVKILENLRHIQGAPSVQMHHPPEAMHVPGEDEEGAGGDMDVDVRPKEYPNEKVVPDNELYDIKKEL
jgi:histone deacetylase 1/2